jgi:hypothetical protein
MAYVEDNDICPRHWRLFKLMASVQDIGVDPGHLCVAHIGNWGLFWKIVRRQHWMLLSILGTRAPPTLETGAILNTCTSPTLETGVYPGHSKNASPTLDTGVYPRHLCVAYTTLDTGISPGHTQR